MFPIPLPANLTRYLVYGVVILCVLSTVWMHGFFHGEQKLFEERAKLATEKVALVVKQGGITEKVITRYVRTAAKTATTTESIEHEISNLANAPTPEGSDRHCLAPSWGWLHDAAADNRVPGNPRPADGTARAPEAIAALRTVSQNYAACHRTADRLEALQEWVREQRKLTTGSSLEEPPHHITNAAHRDAGL